MPPKVPPKLPPVDPAVLEKADPWVKLLFDHFENFGNRFNNVDESLKDYKEKVKKPSNRNQKQLKRLNSFKRTWMKSVRTQAMFKARWTSCKVTSSTSSLR
jgi:hypothetical protein